MKTVIITNNYNNQALSVNTLIVSPDTHGLKATSSYCLQSTVFLQDYPLYSPYRCRLGYHLSEAWLEEQKALPPQLL